MKILTNNEIKQLDKVMFFGYGSLLYPEGINGRGMQYRYKVPDLKEVVVKGFRRSMSALVFTAYYGIHVDRNAFLNGCIFKIHSLYDLIALLRNEGASPVVSGRQYPNGSCVYKTIDITDTIPEKAREGLPVITLLCDKLIVNPMEYNWHYIRRVYKGVEQHRSEDFLNDFLNTGGIHPATYRDVLEHHVRDNTHNKHRQMFGGR